MKISEVKQEYQLQQWRSMLRERQESGLSVKAWCSEHEISDNIYYYRLRRLRWAACAALESRQPECLAEVPLVPNAAASQMQLRLSTPAGTLEILSAGSEILNRILQALLHAE